MNVRTPVTLVVLASVLVVGSVVGWRYATEDVPSLRESTADDGPTCIDKTFDAGQPLEATSVRINVYNAGDISGLAGQTLRRLSRRGFVSGQSGDADLRVPRRRALVVADRADSPQARLVARQLRGRVTIRNAERAEVEGIGTDVNIYLGNQFRGVKPDARTSVRVRGETTLCVPVDDGS